MKYDASLIQTETININGKKVEMQRIPAGMSGPNGPCHVNTRYEEDDSLTELGIKGDPALVRELDEYMEEGIEPDSDEVRAIKEEIEKEHFGELLEVVEDDDLED